MQCYTCGREMASGESTCRSCGWHRSKLIYTPFCGVVGGFVGSLIGFTFFDMTGALPGVCSASSWRKRAHAGSCDPGDRVDER